MSKKNQNILGLVVGFFLFLFLFFVNFRFNFDPYFFSTIGSIVWTYFAKTISYIFVPTRNGWLQGVEIIWWILAFVYLYFIWKYRSCIGYWTVKIIQTVYKRI